MFGNLLFSDCVLELINWCYNPEKSQSNRFNTEFLTELTPSSPTTPTTPAPLCAAASNDSIPALIRALLTPAPQQQPTPIAIDNLVTKEILESAIENLRLQLTSLLQQEITTLASSIAISTPSINDVKDIIVNTLSASTSSLTKPTVTFASPVSSCISSDSDSDSSSEASPDPDSDAPVVNATTTSDWKVVKKSKSKKGKKKVSPAPSSQKPSTTVTDLRSIDELSSKDLYQAYRDKKAKEPLPSGQWTLTDEEKMMDLSELARKWKIEDQKKRLEKVELKDSDFEPLGQLTEQEKLLNRGAIRRIIRDRKDEQWVKRMKAMNVEVTICPGCNRPATSRHICFATKLGNTSTKGISRGLVVSQDGKSIQIKQKTILDQDKLDEEFQEIMALKKEVDERTTRIRQALQATPDTPMEEAPATPTQNLVPGYGSLATNPSSSASSSSRAPPRV